MTGPYAQMKRRAEDREEWRGMSWETCRKADYLDDDDKFDLKNML